MGRRDYRRVTDVAACVQGGGDLGLDGDSLAAAYREQRTYPAVKAHQESEDRVEGPSALPRSASRNGKTGEANL